MKAYEPTGYDFVKSLDNGFFGPTYLVQEKSSNTLKICKIALKSKIGNSTAVQRFIERQYHIGSINSPFIVPYTNIIEESDFVVLIRSYIESPSLVQVETSLLNIEENNQVGKFPKLFSQNNTTSGIENVDYNAKMAMWKIVIRTFAHLHSHHIYPTLIRPNNLFLINNQYILITDIYTPSPDFDILSHSPNTFDLAFLAPEFFTHSTQPSQSADVWSLGVILFFIMTNSVPWDKKNVFLTVNQITSGKIDFKCDLPNDILEIISLMIVVDPNQRITLHNLTIGNFKSNKKIVHTLESTPTVSRITLDSSHDEFKDRPESSPILYPSPGTKTMARAGFMLLNKNHRKSNNANQIKEITRKQSVPELPFLLVRKRAIP
ncbi:serine/threonine protein kinase [Tritrichomonas foetus]|uniref:Serine/threonine protein kinase n=1 Tax=Tritrichomonas foetus TaxID=1144522 RepID=A0A1J4JHS1_9EUKA|nr:serine/threonine protein kinase [Tritrichomonas foetus]|eukprot:OHS97163.1 serine/threonine protein kinase [Tritrichomonas foetus]